MQALRDHMSTTMLPLVLSNPSVAATFRVHFEDGYGAWRSERGERYASMEAYELMLRAMQALPEEQDTDEKRAALRAWLPPPSALLSMAELECTWRAEASAHPVLLAALLYGERLGEWSITAEVVAAVLRFEPFAPLLRTEAFRLLGRAHAALGDRAAACEHAESAAYEAAKAGYRWLEMLALRDLCLAWDEGSDKAAAATRLRGVVAQLVTAPDELAVVLGKELLPLVGLSCEQ